MKKITIYIATGRPAEIYESDGFDEMVKVMDDEWENGLLRYRFDTVEELRAFQIGLDVAASCCGDFCVISDEDVEKHPRICKRLVC